MRRETLLLVLGFVVLPVALAIAIARSDDPAPPPMTEIESANMRALNLEIQRVNTLYELATAAKDKADHAAQDANEHMAALKRELETARKGWTIDMQSGKWTQTAPPSPPVKK